MKKVLPYAYFRADGVPVAQPLFQVAGGGSIPTSALQLKFDTCEVQTAIELNALWHSVLPNISAFNITMNPLHICYTAEYENGYYAVAIWSSPVALNRMKWGREEVIELRRLAIANNAPKNTATRMLSWMTKDLKKRFPELLVLVSYQAVEHHQGTIYKAANWVQSVKSKPTSWHKRGAKEQTTSEKVRWELYIR